MVGDNFKSGNPIITMLLKAKFFYLSMVARFKSFFQKANAQSEVSTEHDDLVIDTNPQSANDQSSELENDKEMWFDTESHIVIEEDEFFDAVEEIESNKYYHINSLQEATDLRNCDGDTLALTFSVNCGGVINGGYNLDGLIYSDQIKSYLISFSDGNDSFALITNSFQIYMPSYFQNNQKKPYVEAFGDNQVVILLQKPESVNLPPKGWVNNKIWNYYIEKNIKNKPIILNSDFPTDFIHFSFFEEESGKGKIIQSINTNAESLAKEPNWLRERVLSMVNDISNKQEKIDWEIKDILIRGNIISLDKPRAIEQTNEDNLVPHTVGTLNDANIQQPVQIHRLQG